MSCAHQFPVGNPRPRPVPQPSLRCATQCRLEQQRQTALPVCGCRVLLWEMCAQQRAWAGLRIAQIVHRVAVKGEALPFPPDTPPGLKVGALSCRCHRGRAAIKRGAALLAVLRSTRSPATVMAAGWQTLLC